MNWVILIILLCVVARLARHEARIDMLEALEHEEFFTMNTNEPPPPAPLPKTKNGFSLPPNIIK